MLPYFSGKTKSKKHISSFIGYTKQAVTKENQIVDMRNMCFDNYPAISVRKPRRIAKTLTKPNGLYAGDNLYWVDKTTLFKDGIEVCTVADSQKSFVSMGAYIIIMPDGIVVNTADNTYGYMDTCHNVQSVSLHFCDINGENCDEPSGYLKLYCEPSFVSVNDYLRIYDCDESLEGWHRVCAINRADASNSIAFIAIDFEGESIPTNTAMKIGRDFPSMDYMVEVENRLWGCSSQNHELYASGLGSPFNWHRYEGISTDSYAATVGSQGDFTGAATLYSYAYFFKEGCIHKVYGSKPSEFCISQYSAKGVAGGSEGSIAYVNGGVCYHSSDGFYFFQGSTPVCISGDLRGARYHNAVAGSINNKYYVSAFEEETANSSNSVLLCYDFNTDLWAKLDNVRITQFALYKGLLYGLSSQGEILCFDDGDRNLGVGESVCEDDFEWFCTLDGLLQNPYNAKYLIRLTVDIEVEKSAIFEVSYDNDVWTRVYETRQKGRQIAAIPCSPSRCQKMKLRIRGGGSGIIYSITKTFDMGGDF